MEKIIIVYNTESLLNNDILNNLKNEYKYNIVYDSVNDIISLLGRNNKHLVKEIEDYKGQVVSVPNSIEIVEVPIDKNLYKINKLPIEHIEYNFVNLIIKKIKETEVTKENAYNKYNELKDMINGYKL
jgi:hypothetical protein